MNDLKQDRFLRKEGIVFYLHKSHQKLIVAYCKATNGNEIFLRILSFSADDDGPAQILAGATWWDVHFAKPKGTGHNNVLE